MVKISDRSIQFKIITEMNFRYHPKGGLGMSIRKAAMQVFEMFNFNVPTGYALLTPVSFCTIRRWYKHWLSFWMLSCDMKHRHIHVGTLVKWTEERVSVCLL